MPRRIDMIVVHCSWTPPSADIGAHEIRQWHVDGNGWSDIGYHYVICRNGEVETGRDLDGDGDVLEEVGAHAFGFNAHSVGICLVGGKGEDGGDETNFTEAQYLSLKGLLRELGWKCPGAQILGHNDLTDAKTCPTFDVKAWVRDNLLCAA